MPNGRHRRVFAKSPASPQVPAASAPPPAKPGLPQPPLATRLRYEISGTLETVSPLHVGTGDARTIPEIADDTEVQTLVRDCRNEPFLPGSTLKGLLRRVGEARHIDCVDDLFGVIRDANSGTQGALLVRGAAQKTAAVADKMPFVKRAAAELGMGVFVAARTAIDRHAGTARDTTLRYEEMVAAGAKFGLDLVLDVRASSRDLGCFKERAAANAARAKKLLEGLAAVLEALTDPAGHAIGKGQADGQGRVRLLPESVTIIPRRIDEQGKLINAGKALVLSRQNSAKPSIELTLFSEGPFLVADSSHVPKHDTEGNPEGPQVAAQQVGNEPLLLGSSVAGALRTRAEWLQALQRLKAKEKRVVDPEKAELKTGQHPDTLSPAQRLFGVTGFRGFVDILKIDVTAKGSGSFASVCLDRFSGAPIDNKLFNTTAFWGVRLTLQLALSTRNWCGPATEDEALFDMLLDDIRKNGLMLGHGGNTGFGWFTFESETRHGG